MFCYFLNLAVSKTFSLIQTKWFQKLFQRSEICKISIVWRHFVRAMRLIYYPPLGSSFFQENLMNGLAKFAFDLFFFWTNRFMLKYWMNMMLKSVAQCESSRLNTNLSELKRTDTNQASLIESNRYEHTHCIIWCILYHFLLKFV